MEANEVEFIKMLNEADSAHDCNEVGRALLRKRQHTNAVKAFQRSIEIDADYWFGWCNLGATYSKLELWEQAIKALQTAISLEPFELALGDPYYYISIAYRWTDQNYKAIEYLHKALNCSQAIDFVSSDAKVELGINYIEIGDKTEALNNLVEASEEKDPEAFVLVGMIMASSNRHQDALMCYQKVANSDANEWLSLYVDQYHPPFTFGRIPTRVSKKEINMIDFGM